MQQSDFQIGQDFYTATGQWRCTDIGSRTITAIAINDDDESLYWGPTYAVPEIVFDTDDFGGCHRHGKIARMLAREMLDETENENRLADFMAIMSNLPHDLATGGLVFTMQVLGWQAVNYNDIRDDQRATLLYRAINAYPMRPDFNDLMEMFANWVDLPQHLHGIFRDRLVYNQLEQKAVLSEMDLRRNGCALYEMSEDWEMHLPTLRANIKRAETLGYCESEILDLLREAVEDSHEAMRRLIMGPDAVGVRLRGINIVEGILSAKDDCRFFAEVSK